MTGSGDAAHASPLPLTAEGVTAAWLSAALRTRYVGVVITQSATPTSSPTGVGFVDWQTVAVGPWVHDVNYFLVSALDHAEVALTLIVRERHPQIGGKPQHLALVGDQPGRWGTLHPAALGLGQSGGGGWRAAQAR
jgi:hypothetical protein